MCGRHSKGQCTPAENGNVERVTEVDAQWAAHPIPVCWARRPLWRQRRSIQSYHIVPKRTSAKFCNRAGGSCRVRILMGVARRRGGGRTSCG